MRKSIFIAISLTLNYLCLFSQEKYFVSFNDKSSSPFSIERPSEFLSIKSIERRANQGIAIDYSDLPVSPIYLQDVRSTGAKILYPLKWFNGVVIECYGDQMVLQILNLSMVKGLEKVFEPGKKSSILPEEEVFPIYTVQKDPNDYYFYGSSSNQIKMLNGHLLHNNGFRGAGITISVIDAGFNKANTLPAFDSLWHSGRVLKVKDFVNPNSNIFEEHPHGTMVLSTMAGNIPGQLVGTAPEANYILIRSEDANSEQIIEEYNMAAALEYSDSIGVDIINSSLGYYEYDIPWQSHPYSQMNGISTPAAKAVNMASEKGMLVVVSAGNEGALEWKHIITPADALESVAVGAVNYLGDYAFFSSLGPSYDGRVKPDIAAMGQNTVVQSPEGFIGSASGTSLSAPIITGLAACLWQALPSITVKNLRHRIKYSSSDYFTPNIKTGYGIPNFALAIDSLPNISRGNELGIFPNPTTGNVKIIIDEPFQNEARLMLFSSSGELLYSQIIEAQSTTFNLDIPKNYPAGLYVVKIFSDDKSMVGKIIKTSNSNEK